MTRQPVDFRGVSSCKTPPYLQSLLVTFPKMQPNPQKLSYISPHFRDSSHQTKNTSVEWTIPNSPLLITCSFTLLTCSHAPTAGHGTLRPFLCEACSSGGGRSKSRGICFRLLKKCQQNARKSAIITGMRLFNK